MRLLAGSFHVVVRQVMIPVGMWPPLNAVRELKHQLRQKPFVCSDLRKFVVICIYLRLVFWSVHDSGSYRTSTLSLFWWILMKVGRNHVEEQLRNC